MSRSADHVRLGPNGLLFCQHCGNEYRMAMPVDLGVMAAAAKAYARSHRTCRPKTPTTAPTKE